ncbi:MAG: HAMP domain-containing histidine kinase [Anaerolineae bacterium]|nr:HAMP domain-containing histidine kinase [Anaerolineae bacterium]MCI0611191.1 HAMP domain-containing histidine kinase [Anaerolineae bacterium]
MNRNSIRWRLPVSYGVVALLAALSLGSVMLLVLRSYYAQQEQDYLLRNALALQPILEEVLQSEPQEGPLQDQIDGLAFLSQTQIRVLDARGQILADSGVPAPDQVVEVSDASKSKWSIPPFGSGPADVPGEERKPILIYDNNGESGSVALPFKEEIDSSGPAPQTAMILPVSASPYGYVFVPAPQSDPTRRSSYVVNLLLTASDATKLGELELSNGPSYGADVISSVSNAWLIASVFAIAIAALVGWFMSKRVTRPVLALEKATRQMEQGDLSVRVDLHDERQQEFLSLANSFNGMAGQVEQTVSTLRAFIADAAHELHTPLTALQTNLELASEEKNASARTRYLSRAQEQGHRLEALVKSLLDLSRIEAVQANHDFVPLDLNQLVNEISEQFASRAEQSDRSFRLDLPGEKIIVDGNELQIKQVLANLLENALKFTPENESITLGLDYLNDKAIITISDTGIGISPDDLPHMFERFHRGRNASEYAGNGLGLAIVKAIVENHAGRVEAQSEGIGKGSTFTVILPIHP